MSSPQRPASKLQIIQDNVDPSVPGAIEKDNITLLLDQIDLLMRNHVFHGLKPVAMRTLLNAQQMIRILGSSLMEKTTMVEFFKSRMIFLAHLVGIFVDADANSQPLDKHPDSRLNKYLTDEANLEVGMLVIGFENFDAPFPQIIFGKISEIVPIGEDLGSLTIALFFKSENGDTHITVKQPSTWRFVLIPAGVIGIVPTQS